MYDPSEALLQLGLYDYVWGDPTMLNVYNSNVQAQKAREAQEQYNSYWKQIELENAKAEKAKAAALERKEKDAKLAELYKQYNNAKGAQERALIKKQIRALEGDNASVESEMLAAYDQDRAQAEIDAQNESVRHSEALKDMAKINALMRKAKKATDKEQIAQSVYDETTYPNMNREERNKFFAELMGIKTVGEKIKEASENEAASHAGKKTGETLADQDLTKKATDAITNNLPPSSLDDAVLSKIRELGYTWTGTKWEKR